MVKYYFGLNNTKLKLISPGFPFSNVARRKYKIAGFALSHGLRSVSIGKHWSRIRSKDKVRTLESSGSTLQAKLCLYQLCQQGQAT